MLLGGYFTGRHTLCVSVVTEHRGLYSKGSNLGPVLWKIERMCFQAGEL